MKRVGFAQLLQRQPRAWQRRVEVVELDLPAAAGDARCIATVRQGALNAAGVAVALQESSLTAVPCRRAEAERRALDFISRRLAAGDTLERSDGLAGLDALATASANVATPAPPRQQLAATPAVPSAPVAALVQRFTPDRWKLEPAARRPRATWRVAERADAGAGPDDADQQALRSLVPRLVDLLESDSDLLDYCLAVAIARLRDAGAAEAMQHLSTRGRSAATRRAAHQAWLLLQAPDAQRRHVDALLPAWQAEVHGDDTADLAPDLLASRFDARQTHWLPLLADWYDVALVHATPRARLLALLRRLPLQPGPFQALRYLYKAAEIRRDAELIGLLHARLENTRATFYNHGGVSRRSSVWTPSADRRPLPPPDPRLAYASRTRDYLRLRGWRTLRRLAELGHSHAPVLAV